jgi:predicted membrane channel-forming protein YqfA (hemolysin III family)
VDGLADGVNADGLGRLFSFVSSSGTTMNPQKKFHLVFSLLMGLMMIFLMTFVITAVNVGFTGNFLLTWAKAFVIAYVVGVPVIFFLAPVARRLTARTLGVPLP